MIPQMSGKATNEILSSKEMIRCQIFLLLHFFAEITYSTQSHVTAFESKTSMRCYSEKTGPKYQICDKSFGFQTCFTKYDDKKQVVLRGCSSKRKMFHIECESHLSGTRNEQFCYCSYDLCNASSRFVSGAVMSLLSLLTSLFVL